MFHRLAALPLLLCSTAALAQEAPRPDAAATDTGADIVVAANRAPVDADRVTASVTVLDKAAIDRAQDLSVADLLLRTPGVSLSRNGGYGTSTSLRIRGAETDQTVVVIDGVKINDPSSPGGGYNFANLLIGDAARIEVLRGPQSILWGSQAIGGVVNIVTPLPTAALEGSIDLEGGSRETVSARAALGGTAGPLAWRVGAQTFITDGISALKAGTERDGYTNQNVQGRAVLTIAPGISADLRGSYANGRNDFDGFGGDTPEYGLTREFVGYAGVNVDLFDARLRNRFGYGYTDTDRDNYNPDQVGQTQTFAALGRNHRVEYQGTLAVTKGVDAVFGVENEVSRFSTASSDFVPPYALGTPARGRAELTSFYGQLNVSPLDGLTLNGGVRHDDHSRFGTQTLFAGGANWVLPTGTVLRASYSEGFKAPTLYQLFSEYGNQALNPERARGWEAGAEQRFMDGRYAIGGTYFERRSRDQIVYTGCDFGSTDPLCFVPGSTTEQRFGYYQNVARAFARGVEAVARAQVGEHLSLDGNYSWVLSEDRSPGRTFGNWLPRRPRDTANVSATYTFAESGSFGVAARFAGKSFDNASNATRLGGYTLVDVRGELPLSGNVRLFARVENLFDERYETIARYGTLGRSVYAGLRGRF
ncbi:TonB-dependent receptor plug domain-containing protein [Sphingomonas sp. 8AM]|uniref:TonB-dependent receptor plug domain-containing protein n=1 Tax=Sphingomonas sp. 8AM TaxID=2653170 RepID=UPI0012EFF7EC|nr:TonB-dependent receptor [Sphingomonas sp. 8AM]VXC48450.1 TonB-dependent receptor [Sphingomonas sp. 8AM]